MPTSASCFILLLAGESVFFPQPLGYANTTPHGDVHESAYFELGYWKLLAPMLVAFHVHQDIYNQLVWMPWVNTMSHLQDLKLDGGELVQILCPRSPAESSLTKWPFLSPLSSHHYTALHLCLDGIVHILPWVYAGVSDALNVSIQLPSRLCLPHLKVLALHHFVELEELHLDCPRLKSLSLGRFDVVSCLPTGLTGCTDLNFLEFRAKVTEEGVLPPADKLFDFVLEVTFVCHVFLSTSQNIHSDASCSAA